MKIKELLTKYGKELSFTSFKQIMIKEENITMPKEYYYEKYGHYKNWVKLLHEMEIS